MTREISIAVLILVFCPILCRAQPGLSNDASARCKALESSDLSKLPDAPTQVTEATLKEGGDTVAYCEVGGYVAPSVGFLLRMPSDHWNKKLLELGCGGTCGSTAHIRGCAGPLRRGYACIVSDGGNRSSGRDMKWAYNSPQAVIEYLARATHITALAGKALIERYYSQTPDKSYFMGCSAGGIQGMWEAQRFPWDFDGIIAGAPALNLTGIWMNFLWDNRALTGNTGLPLLGKADFDVLHHAVLEKCDLNDGIKDGLIGDPRTCHFDLSELRCTDSRQSRCLTTQQIAAVEKVYNGPATSNGEQIVKPTALKGSELTWPDFFVGSAANPTPFYNYIGEWFRYYFFSPNPGPMWEPAEFDFDRDYKRLGMAEVSEPVNDPDLRRFKASGGKLLLYSGWSDAIEGVLRTVDYYETAERVMGGRAPTQDFFRLFVIPGMNHCEGGDGAFAVDYLNYLEAWVERGKPPDKMLGFHLTLENPSDAENLEFPLDHSVIKFSRPVYPYPTTARYQGNGNLTDAESFVPAN